jgi:hypothetical protein
MRGLQNPRKLLLQPTAPGIAWRWFLKGATARVARHGRPKTLAIIDGSGARGATVQGPTVQIRTRQTKMLIKPTRGRTPTHTHDDEVAIHT